jgi:BNR repeat-like domain
VLSSAAAGDVVGTAVIKETQAAQSKRYAMADGTFRNPLLVGTGAFSVGSAATIADTGRYLAWPVVCRIRESRVLLAYTDADGHHTSNDGKAVGRIGTEGANGAITWGSQFDIYDDASLFSTVYGISQVSSGRIFAALWRDNFSVSGTGEAGLSYSDDEGATWSAWIDLDTPSGFTQESYGAGPVVELPNGDLVLTVEGSNSGDPIANRSSKLLRSTNGGTTWGSAVTIAAYGARPYYESKLLLLDNDRLLCIHRTSSGTGTHYTNYSDDNGATWSTPAAGPSGYGAPSCVQLSTGTVMFVTRRNSDEKTIAYASTDRGASWGSEIVIDTGGTQMEYGCPLELLDGRVLVVYGDQPTASLTNSDIDQRILTETVTTLGGTSRVGMQFEKEMALSDLTTALTTGTTKGYFRPAFAATGVSARLSLRVTSSSGVPTVDMNKNGASMMSTKLTIDVGELTSLTAATPVVMSSTTWAADDLIEFDIDVAGTGAMGAIITVTGLYA